MCKKTQFVFFVAAAFGCFLLFSCGQKSQAGSEAKPLTAEELGKVSGDLYYWSCFTGDSKTWDEERVANFQKEFPQVKVDMQSVPESAGVRNGKLLAAIASGTPPDVICADDYISTYGFVAQDAFESWDPYMEAMGLSLDSFMPGFHNVILYNDKMYLLPQDSNVIMLYLNTDMVREAGLDINNYPKTIDELNDWTDKLTKKDASGRVVQYGYIPWLDSTEDPTFWPFWFGAEMYNSSAKNLELTDSKVVSALNWQREYANKYDPAEIKGFTQSAGGLFSPDHPFFVKKVAMTVVGNWATNALRIYAPSVNYKCVPVPAPSGGRERSTPLGSNVFAIPKGAKRPDLAAFFFKYTQRPEVNADNFDIWRSIPTSDEAFDEVSWTKKGDEIYLMERQISNSPKSAHPALSPVSAQLRQDLIALRDSVIYNNADPLPLLQELQNKLQPELDRLK
ncbi:MAG: extracellular solute-binding protein [Treponema sp.]|jgi:ABC-type glycerol-3-phosphate transport system substrate-binding protein|nr:extracellular solute-binding protein [Treponema sp.]